MCVPVYVCIEVHPPESLTLTSVRIWNVYQDNTRCMSLTKTALGDLSVNWMGSLITNFTTMCICNCVLIISIGYLIFVFRGLAYI